MPIQQTKKQHKTSPEQKKPPIVSRFQAVPQDSDSILDMSTEDSWRPPLPQNLLRKENQQNTSKPKPKVNAPFQYNMISIVLFNTHVSVRKINKF